LAAVAVEALLSFRARPPLPGAWLANTPYTRAAILIPAWLITVAVLTLGLVHLPSLALLAAVAALIALRLALETVARTRGRTQQALDDTRALIDSAGCGLAVLDRDGCLLCANAAARQLLGLPGQGADGGELSEFLPPDARVPFRKAFSKALAAQEPVTLEIDLPATATTSGASGIDRWAAGLTTQMSAPTQTLAPAPPAAPPAPGNAAQVILSAVPNARGQAVQVAVAIADITPHRRAAEQLTAQKDAAEGANRAKSDLLADMGHQIRSPMSGVIDMARMALGTQLTPEQRGYMETVRESAQSLLDVVNDLLDFSMLEAGKLVIEPSAMSLNDCLDRAIAPFSLPAAAAGVEIVRSVAADVPDDLVGDSKRLRQVMGYLMSNALHSTSRGQIEVKVDVEGRPPRELLLHTMVRDTGAGLPEKELAAIFQPAFQQAGGQARPEGSGSGLGLAIAWRLVGIMGGSIRAASQVGQGSEFHFTVRLGVREKAAARSGGAAIADLQDVAVLVVDHDAASRNILERTLSRWRMQPTCVNSSHAALDQLDKARQTGKAFALVILDAAMPDMDSFDLAEQIRNATRQGNTAMVMLSSHPKAEHLDLAQSVGIGAYLNKPIRQSELLEALGRALSKPPAGAEGAGGSAGAERGRLFVPPPRTAPTPAPVPDAAPAAAPAAAMGPTPTPAIEPDATTPAATEMGYPPAPKASPAAARPAAKAPAAKPSAARPPGAKAPAAKPPVAKPPAAKAVPPAMGVPKREVTQPVQEEPPAPPTPAPRRPAPAVLLPEAEEEELPELELVEPDPGPAPVVAAAAAPVPEPIPEPIPAPAPAPSPEPALAETGSPQPAPTAAALPPSDQALRILVADGNPDNQKALGRMLEKAGHLVASVPDGVEVLDALASEEFDLILMDVQMPRLDGVETTADIRRTEAGTDRHVPIVALAERFNQEEEARCRQAGMDAYLCQPIDSDSLLAAIATATRRKTTPGRPQPAAGAW
jgi:signal transduction histidine kinase/DNA-binding response OmpR family regulator